MTGVAKKLKERALQSVGHCVELHLLSPPRVCISGAHPWCEGMEPQFFFNTPTKLLENPHKLVRPDI